MTKTILLLTLLLTQYSFASETACIETKNDIIEKIKCLKLVTITDTGISADGIPMIDMTINQPMDHNDPSSVRFEQRVVLLHLDESEPMLLQTSGYSIFRVRQAHIARVFGTNQLQIEHRYFEKSIPKNPDWKLLNIEQSAADFHVITETFKKIYQKPWVNTGASKGGMTSSYHRYFYPNDTVGTVADVAPLSFSTSDQRYNVFMENVGGETYKTCRDKFKELQALLLENRHLFVPNIQGSFDQLGGAAVAYEHSVIEASFYFWQYGNPVTCLSIPQGNDVFKAFDFFQELAAVDGYKDSDLKRFAPYFYQSATELGGPDNVTYHLEHLRHFDFSVAQYTPKGEELIYTNAQMRKIKEWALNDADNIMYIYGEFDPWTAGEYPVSITGKNTPKYFVPAGNHSANFTKLVGKDKSKAIDLLSTWLGKRPVKKSKTFKQAIPTLDEVEFSIRKMNRL